MADLRFPRKSRKYLQGFGGSLARRVMILCAAFVVLPLAFYVWLIDRQSKETRLRDIASDLGLLSGEQLKLAEDMLYQGRDDLFLASLVCRSCASEEIVDQLLKHVVLVHPGWTLFSLQRQDDGSLQVIRSSNPECKGKTIPLPTTESMPFAASDDFSVCCLTWDNQPFFFLTQTAEECQTFALIIPAQSLLRLPRLSSGLFSDVDVELLCHGKRLFKERGLDDVGETTWFSLEELSLLAQGKKRGDWTRIGTEVLIPGTPLQIRFVMSSPFSTSYREEVLWQRLSIFILILILLGGAAAFILTRRMARPLKALDEIMNQVGEGQLDVRYQYDLLGFEINVLGEHFNRMLEELLAHMEVVKNERIAREMLERELAIGHEIQKNIFPRSIPELTQLAMAAGFLPAKEVAGDFYDLFLHSTSKGERLLIVMADTSGKGISACLYSFILRSMLRSFASSGKELADLVRLANALLCLDTSDTGMFVTAWVGLLDIDSFRLEYASLGHYPAIRKLGSIPKLEELQAQGSAFGVTFTKSIEIGSVVLQSQDVLVLYTDGMIEAENIEGEPWGKKRLLECVAALPQELSVDEVIAKIQEELRQHIGQRTLEDDVTLLVLKKL